jgi:hypothetical protein
LKLYKNSVQLWLLLTESHQNDYSPKILLLLPPPKREKNKVKLQLK